MQSNIDLISHRCRAQAIDVDKVIFSTRWITVKESPRGFQYLERKGKDSVAVFLLRNSGGEPEQCEVLIRKQHLCIDNREIDGKFRLFPCPVTGALEDGELPEATAQREVYEETGYRVEASPMGQYIVGTQVNEICYLYYADVTNMKPDVPQQNGTYLESIAQNEWHPFKYLESCDFSACQIGYLKLRKILYKSAD